MFNKKINQVKSLSPTITTEEAQEAVRTLLKYIGEDTEREGLLNTPRRVITSFSEYFEGYKEDPIQILKTTFEETSGYKDMILLKNIDIVSHCEHHLAPIKGHAHIAYYPNERVVGISKLARVAQIYSRRLQIQERLTAEIANSINFALKPKGVAVVIEASHFCLNNRGVNNPNVKMRTNSLLGCFADDELEKSKFLQAIA